MCRLDLQVFLDTPFLEEKWMIEAGEAKKAVTIEPHACELVSAISLAAHSKCMM